MRHVLTCHMLAGTARITDGALGTLIGEYCREAGVRKLKQQLEKIYRKVALRLVKRGASAKVRPAPLFQEVLTQELLDAIACIAMPLQAVGQHLSLLTDLTYALSKSAARMYLWGDSGHAMLPVEFRYCPT